MTIKEVLVAHPETIESGQRFQKQLADFIIEHDLQTIVETGSGTSSVFILQALEKRGSGFLYSIDPFPVCNYEIKHPMYELINKKSTDAMTELYLRTGAWDFFLHDSDHDILCQTYEYEMAYACLKDNGFLASDDYGWGGHKAWDKFVSRHALSEFKIGNIIVVQKKDEAIPISEIERYSKECLELAIDAEKKWLADGNKNSFYDIYPSTRQR